MTPRILVSICLMLFLSCNDKPESVNPSNNILTVSPSPAVYYMDIHVSKTDPSTYTLKVVGADGRHIFDERLFEPGVYDFRLNLDQRSEGYYFVVLDTGDELITRKILHLFP